MIPLKKLLRERRVTIGTWIQAPHPAIVEVLANAGYDWIALECEHSENDVRDFAVMARAAAATEAAPMVRVRENDPLVIRRMLDMGAEGVIVPLIHSAEDARRAVQAARFPPDGVRGFSFSRMNDWGVGFEEYLATANERIAVIPMVESRESVEQIDAIVAVDGVDGVFIGPYDLSGSYGIPGQTDHPTILEARAKVVDACRNAGKSAGLHVVIATEDAIARAVADGFNFIAVASDIIILNEASRRTLEAARKAVSAQSSQAG